jgi:dolichyl-diphosphooligosaccharide--protein glycosyltransferase
LRSMRELGGRLAGVVKRVFRGKLILVEIFLLISILFLGFMIRILPMRWGVYLLEFDPWMQFKEMSYVIERGWRGFIDFFSWHDYTSWYPYGRDVGRTAFPGLPFMAAFIYHILHGIGVEVNALELAAIFPPIMAVVAILFAYLLGRELGGRPAGLLSAFFLAVSSGHIERSLFGWFDDESIGVPLMLIGLWAYIQALKEGRSKRGIVTYAVPAGLSLGYMTASWGAAKFPLAFIPLISVLLALLGRYRRELLTAFTITFSTYTLIALMVPKLGPGYLKEITILAGFAAFIILLSFEASRLLPGGVHAKRLPYYVIAAGAAGFAALMALGVAGLPGFKFLSVLIPSLRNQLPIFVSVAENQLSTWSIIFRDLGFQSMLMIIGIYYALKRGRDEDIILAAFTILSIYFSSTMVRLSTLAAPSVAILAGLGLAELVMGFARSVRAAALKPKTRAVGIEYYLLTPLLVGAIFLFSFTPGAYGIRYPLSGIDAAYAPPTIVSSSLPVRAEIPAWLKALEWVRENLPEDAVVASWWDYGYWITILGNRTSVVDNSTLNSTQIGEVGYAFMSNEETAYRVFRNLGATHVLIFVTHYPYGQQAGVLLGYGEEGKWIWMLRIAVQEGHQLNESEYVTSEGNPTDKFWSETTLGQLIPFKPYQISGQTYYVYNPSSLKHFKLVYSSDEPYTSYAYVYIYELVD